MDTGVPAGAQDLGDAPGVGPVRLVAHRGQRRLDLAGLQAHRLEPFRTKTMGQRLAQGAGLEADNRHLLTEVPKAGGDLRYLRSNRPFQTDPARPIDDAERDRSQGYIQCSVKGHLRLLVRFTRKHKFALLQGACLN